MVWLITHQFCCVPGWFRLRLVDLSFSGSEISDCRKIWTMFRYTLFFFYAPPPSKKISRSILGMIEQFSIVMSLGLRKNLIFCSWCSFSLQGLHILKRNLIYRFIIIISRLSLILGTFDLFFIGLCPLDFKKFPTICTYLSFSSQRSPIEGK